MTAIDRGGTLAEIEYRLKPPLTNAELNVLFSVGWPSWQTAPDCSDWQLVLAKAWSTSARMRPAC